MGTTDQCKKEVKVNREHNIQLAIFKQLIKKIKASIQAKAFFIYIRRLLLSCSSKVKFGSEL